MSKPRKLNSNKEIQDQKQVWDSIAEKWQEFRNKPLRCVKEFLKNKQGKILDLGCGNGRNFLKKKGIKWFGVDFSHEMVKNARKNAEKKNIKAVVKKASAWKIPFKDNFFDYALYIAVLHCIPNEDKRKKSLKELKRVLKKKGRALITVWDKKQKKFKNKGREAILPWKIKKRGKIKSHKRYYRLYEREEILNLVKKYFKIINFSKKAKTRFEKRNIIIEVEN